MPADELGTGRLLHDDVDDVLAVEVALVAEERLLAVIVVFCAVFELPREAPVGKPRQLGLERPAGEGARCLADIHFGVVAGAEAEQFQQFAAPVLVDRGAMVLVVVEPEQHRRVLRDRHQQVAVVAHAALAEQLDLLEQLIVVVDLRVAGGEHAVPEQRHLFFERALGVHQVVHVVDVAHWGLPAGEQRRRLMPQQRVGIHRWLRVGVQQFLDRRVVSLRHARLEFVATCSEARASHQMGHQSDVFLVGHAPLLLPAISYSRVTLDARPLREFLNLWRAAWGSCMGATTRPKCVREACTLDLFVVGPAPMMRFPPPNSCFTGSAIHSKPCNPPSPLSTWRERATAVSTARARCALSCESATSRRGWQSSPGRHVRSNLTMGIIDKAYDRRARTIRTIAETRVTVTEPSWPGVTRPSLAAVKRGTQSSHGRA